MRTKTLLLAAAAFAVGTVASVAQTVYSVNAVGYVNLTLKSSYNLISNPLNGTNNNVNTIMPVAPADSQAIRWNPATQSFNSAGTYIDAQDPALNGWYDSQLNKSADIIAPGEGFFFFNPTVSDYVLTFVGEVPQGNLTNTIPANYSFKASIVPQSVAIESVGFPGVADMQYFIWNPNTQSYGGSVTYIDAQDPAVNGFYDSQLNRVFPTPAVGQGFVIFNPGPALSWGRNFSVN
ncbi:MAG TPA: hypothetical protein VGF13_02955 [Verrucomicrobiae bacterium]|jgi:hypothetical protein